MSKQDNFSANFSELLQAKRDTKAYLKEKGDKWTFDNESVEDFDYFFREVLQGKKIQDIVDQLKKSKKSISAANFFGGKKVLEELGVDEGVAVRLEKKSEDQDNIKTVEGSLLDKKTWSKIPENLDLVLSMPRGALYQLPYSPDISYFMINNAWKKMNPDGSVALFQVPRWMGKEFETWVRALEKQGVHITFALTQDEQTDKDVYYAVLLVRDQNSPTDLPTF